MRTLTTLALVLVTGCSSTAVVAESTTTSTSTPTSVRADPLADEGHNALEDLMADVFTTDLDSASLDVIVEQGDLRVAWVLTDLLRFYQAGDNRDSLVSAFTRLTGAVMEPGTVDFVWATDHLLSADVQAWDGYRDIKKQIYTRLDERWGRLFDGDQAMDWRLVTWGGVGIDDRPFGDNGPCNCIPALDNPKTTGADEGDWYPDEKTIFGLVVNGEALALPKHQMQTHEMVNITLGGRDLGIPYCTLCGSAQAYFTDGVTGTDRVVLRTSGLLSRSNKVMYDLDTGSVFDTFTGEARTGRLAAAGGELEQTTVLVSTWGDWKAAHPETQILAKDGGIGATYRSDPLGDRDANGPIFPVGEVDTRLAIQEPVIGVIKSDGTPIAFEVAKTRLALEAGEMVTISGLTAELTDGIRVYDQDGTELSTHESFWFAWSQFHPDTLIWNDG